MHKNKKSLKVFFLADWDAPLPEWMRKKQEWAICILHIFKYKAPLCFCFFLFAVFKF